MSDAADPVQPARRDRARLAEALATVGDRWTLLIVAALLDGPRRFGDLQAEVGGIAPNVLTQRLRAARAHALVVPAPTPSARRGSSTSSAPPATSWPAPCACSPGGARATPRGPPRPATARWHPDGGALVVPDV